MKLAFGILLWFFPLVPLSSQSRELSSSVSFGDAFSGMPLVTNMRRQAHPRGAWSASGLHRAASHDIAEDHVERQRSGNVVQALASDITLQLSTKPRQAFSASGGSSVSRRTSCVQSRLEFLPQNHCVSIKLG